jgi:hypothetical protein
MKERDRQERKRFMDEYAAEEQAKEERRLAPVRAAEAELTTTHRQLLKIEREAALHGKEDPLFARGLLSEPMKTIRLNTLEEANEHNLRTAREFMERTPSFYQSQYNAELITDFAVRNDLLVLDAQTYGNVYRHLDGLGLMEHEPASEPQPEPLIEQPEPVQQMETEGVDDSGRVRLYSKAEIARMSADEYRRFMRIPTKAYAEYQEAGSRW